MVSTIDGNVTEAKDVGEYTFRVNVESGEGTIATNYSNFDELSAILSITPANMADENGTALKFDSNLFFKDATVGYDATPKGILLSSTVDGSVVSSTPVTSWKIYPENNTSHTLDSVWSPTWPLPPSRKARLTAWALPASSLLTPPGSPS